MKKFVLWIITTLWLGFWMIFAQNILPDSAEISVKDPIIMWEATNLKVTMIKNWSKMSNYDWTIWMIVTDLDWKALKEESDYIVPSRWTYKFSSSDLWEKEFQRWLEIKKEWTFYIEIQDLYDDEEKVLWKQIIHVVKQNSTANAKSITVLNPVFNTNLVNDKVEIIATATDMPNSQAIIYIDWIQAWITNVDSRWSINYTVGNLSVWPHLLSIEIPDLEWNIMWSSNEIPFTISIANSNWIKNVVVNPENGLMIWDMTNITVYTDEMVESVKMKLSDRPENESIVMNKNWAWEFSQNVFLIWTWEISLSFDITSSNNTISQPFNDYKKITVSDVPLVSDIKVNTSASAKTADISRESVNDSNVYSYLINRWVEWSSTLSGKDWTEQSSFKFRDVPYDTIINFTITPYRNKQSNHWAASKTIQFIITKDQKDSCGNSICENWESHELCPQDCQWEWETTIMLWASCSPQTISTRTSKVWDSYYLIRDKAEGVSKYIVYSSTSPDWKDKVKVYETTDTSYEYPFDHTSGEDVFMYFRIIWVCEDWEELELTWATKVQVWPAENFFLLLCLTFLIYFWIKLFRQTEE